MRNLKKFLALVLAMMMAFSLMVTANAAKDVNARDIYPDADQVTDQFKEAVDVLYGMGVMTGDYGNFKPGSNIMRSEMAAIMYRVMTGDTSALKNQLYADQAARRFKDVKETDWFAPYIGWCYDAGLMKGYDGWVRPWDNVTGYEAEIMILRAMGYGKNGEYNGTYWSVNASSDATVVGLLKDIGNTNYANTLAQYSRRDVVASMVFQGVQLPTVTWNGSTYNQYVGVPIGTGGNILNPSLGEKYFGLTYHYGIVVGNQATGETGKFATKIGFSVNPVITKGLDIGDDLTGAATSAVVKGYLNSAAIVDDCDQAAYYYLSDNNAITGTAENVTLAFDWKTDLTLFNHMVKVWYDARGNGSVATVALGSNTGSGSVSFGTNCKTYALYDEATTVVVTSPEQTDASLTTAVLADLANGRADNENNWSKTRLRDGGNAFFNYAFSRMAAANYGTNVGAGSKVSPIHDNDEATANEHGLYLLISNGTGYIDVVISLDMTFSQIVQSNTTTYPYSVGVLAANETGAAVKGGNIYFGDADDYGRLTDTVVGTTTNYVSLMSAALVDTDEASQKLGTKIAAIEVTGTAGTQAATAGTGGMAPAAYGDDYISTSTYADGSTFYYKLAQNTLHKTAKVVKVDTANNDVYLEGVAEPLHQSVFAEATDATFTTDIEGYTNKAPVTFRLVAGNEYTFTLDEQGNYIYWETPSVTSKFVYATYIDWETKTASSLFDYPMVHVDANGTARQLVNVTSIDTVAMGNSLYDTITLNKRDSRTSGNNSGYVPGTYIGYALGSDGALTTITSTDSKGTGFLQDDSTYFGQAGGIVINSTNVAVGAKEAGAAGSNMFLTENTQFYIVDGAGTENETVKPVKGISALMEGMDSVEIHGESGYLTAANIGNYLDPTTCADPYKMFYYHADRFEYDQNYDPSALEIKTLFLPAECIEWNASSTSSLVFVGDKTATMINANNGNWATQFTMWRNGESSNVWIEGDYTSAVTNDANTIVTNGDNVFYELVATSKKATDGNVIYKIKGMTLANANKTIIGQFWDGTAVDTTENVGTAYGTAYSTGLYKATTFNQQAAYIENALYNVGSAGIKNLDTVTYPGIKDNTLSTLNGAGSLANNDGVPVSCILNTDDALRLTVSFIYVNA